MRNVPSSVFWFAIFFLPFLHRTSVQKWKKNWFCYVHKWIGKKEMSVETSKYIASAKILEHEASISPFRFQWQPPGYWSQDFSLACQVDEFSFKEMKTWGQFKFISYCICLVWIRRTRRQEFKIPLCNSSGGNLLRHSCQISTTEVLCVKSQQPKQVDCFRKKTPPQTSDQILNADPTKGSAKVGCGWNASAWNSWP